MKISRLQRNPILLIMLIVGILHSGLSVFAKDSTSEFLDRLKKIRISNGMKKAAWVSPDSPWYPYLQVQFSNGLTLTDKARHLMLQTRGKCDELPELERRGFDKLYSEMGKVLENEFANSIFLKKIIPIHSFGYRRCKALAMLNPIIQKAQEKGGDDYAMYLPIAMITALPKFQDSNQLRNLRSSLTELMRLAACEDYVPALSDMMRFDTERLLLVSWMKKYYFLRRVGYHGMEIPDLNRLALEIERYHGPFILVNSRRALDAGDLKFARQEFRYMLDKCHKPWEEPVSSSVGSPGKKWLGVHLNQR